MSSRFSFHFILCKEIKNLFRFHIFVYVFSMKFMLELCPWCCISLTWEQLTELKLTRLSHRINNNKHWDFSIKHNTSDWFFHSFSLSVLLLLFTWLLILYWAILNCWLLLVDFQTLIFFVFKLLSKYKCSIWIKI